MVQEDFLIIWIWNLQKKVDGCKEVLGPWEGFESLKKLYFLPDRMMALRMMMMTPQLKKDDMALSLNAPLSSLCLPPTTAPGQSATTPTTHQSGSEIFVFDDVIVIVIIAVIVITISYHFIANIITFQHQHHLLCLALKIFPYQMTSKHLDLIIFQSEFFEISLFWYLMKP